jgi:AAA family ATP:ADP antiporter
MMAGGRERSRRLVGSFFDVRPGEGARALLLAVHLFIVIGSFYILKPVRSSVFLVSFGPTQLPYVFMLIALVGGGVAGLYSSVARVVRIDRLVIGSSLVIGVALLAFRLLLYLDQGWVSYAFYVLVSLYGGITTSQVWLLANHVFDAREARRLFGMIGAGGIAGSIAGAAIATALAESVRAENLILVAAAMLFASLPLARRAFRLGVEVRAAGGRGMRAADEPERDGPRPRVRGAERKGLFAMLGIIRRSRQLQVLTALIAVMVVASTLVDYIFSTEAYNYFERRAVAEEQSGKAAVDARVKADLTRFFGLFLGSISIVSLLIQLGLTGRVLGRLGVGAANRFMPLALFAATGVFIASPGLIAAAFVRLVEGSMSYSLGKASTELLFVPLPAAIKDRTKTFVDLFADRLARGLAGALILLVTAFMAGTRGVAVLLGVVLVVWIVLLRFVQSEYVASFRRAIAGGTLEVDSIREMVRTPEAIGALTAALAGDERQVLYALTLLESADPNLLVDHLVLLLQHPSADVRRLAMAKLAESRDTAHAAAVEPLAADPVRPVRREAVRYLLRAAGDGSPAALERYLEARDWRLRGAALEVIARYLPAAKQTIDPRLLESLVRVGGEERRDARIVVARAIGALGRENPHAGLLADLLFDPDVRVRAEAMAAAGELKDQARLGRLLAALANPEERIPARAALAAYGEEILPVLEAVLNDQQADVRAREQVPRAIELMQSQPALDVLLRHVEHPALGIRQQVIKAMGKMRARDADGGLRFDPPRVEAAIHGGAREFLTHAGRFLAVSPRGGDDPDSEPLAAGAAALLRQALAERMAAGRERVFRLLGLRYPARDILFAYNGIMSQRPTLKASAIEFLDNTLAPGLKRAVLPVAAETSLKTLAARGRELYQLEPPGRDRALRDVLAGSDAWLVACAIDAVRELHLANFGPDIAPLRAHPQPVVREMAQLVANGS